MGGNNNSLNFSLKKKEQKMHLLWLVVVQVGFRIPFPFSFPNSSFLFLFKWTLGSRSISDIKCVLHRDCCFKSGCWISPHDSKVLGKEERCSSDAWWWCYGRWLAGIWESENITLICFYIFPKWFTKPLIKNPVWLENKCWWWVMNTSFRHFCPFLGVSKALDLLA